MTTPSAPERQLHLVTALRRYGAAHAALMRAFADHFSLHPTDAAALSEILLAEDMAQPLTPSRLADQIGRSRPATSSVLARLEAAGLVRRAPHATDRRAAVLLAGPEIGAAIPAFFQPLSDAMAAHLSRYDPAQLQALVEMLDKTSDCIIANTRVKI